MIYLKLFENHTQYTAYTASTEFIKPNVSHCIQEAEMHYNPWVETRVVAKYNVTSTSSPTPIGYNKYISGFSAIEIDGVEQPSVVSAYTFDTLGEHTVKYTLTDPTSIGSRAFYGCGSLTSINIPSGVASIGSGMCSGCTSLTSVIIPDNVTNIGGNAFTNCSGLTSINIPSGVTNIGRSAFVRCTSLTSMTVDTNNSVYDSRNNCNAIVETLTNTLLFGCKNTVIPNSVTSIGDNAFNSCSGLTSIDIPSGVTSIGQAAFQSCSSLTSIDIPSGVTSIGISTFQYCSSLTSIDIPSGVTSIGTSAFANCSALTSVAIGSGVTSIGNYAFVNCSGLSSITCNAMTAPTIESSTFRDVHTSGTLTVPIGSSGYNTWMSKGNNYLGKYSWTKVEQ